MGHMGYLSVQFNKLNCKVYFLIFSSYILVFYVFKIFELNG